MPKHSKGEFQVDEEMQVNHMRTTTEAKKLKRSKKKKMDQLKKRLCKHLRRQSMPKMLI